MSLREEDRQKNNCTSRGLGLAAAAIGVGVGAALCCFFNKRTENPHGEGSTTSNWDAHTLQHSEEHTSDEEQITLFEHTANDTSLYLSPSENEDDNNLQIDEMISSDVTIEEYYLATGDLESSNLDTGDMESSNLNTSDMESSNLDTGDMESSNLDTSDMESSNLATGDMESSNLDTSDMELSNLDTDDMELSNLDTGDMELSNLDTDDMEMTNLDMDWSYIELPNSGTDNLGRDFSDDSLEIGHLNGDGDASANDSNREILERYHYLELETRTDWARLSLLRTVLQNHIQRVVRHLDTGDMESSNLDTGDMESWNLNTGDMESSNLDTGDMESLNLDTDDIELPNSGTDNLGRDFSDDSLEVGHLNGEGDASANDSNREILERYHNLEVETLPFPSNPFNWARLLSLRTVLQKYRQSTQEEQMRISRERQFRDRSWSLEECSICFEIMLKDHQLTTLPCTHHFHTECIAPWLQEQHTCPNCRKAAE